MKSPQMRSLGPHRAPAHPAVPVTHTLVHNSSGTPAVVWVALAAAAVLFVVGYLVGRRRGAGAAPAGDTGRGTALPGAALVPARPVVVGDGDGRQALVEACIRARDMVSGGSVRRILGDALAEAGVREVDPTGERFDPERHCSVGITNTPDPALDDVVASAERVGYEDRGRSLRAASVIVYSYAGRS
ncbi:MAG TPA: nucleotide exchange factor GrpE [Acidimicrobiales bacterium]|nr:nucleotide exchange factor GrpE [Acidimicrobiales bacterium]